MRGSSKILNADFSCSVDSDITTNEPLDVSHIAAPLPHDSRHTNASSLLSKFSVMAAYQSWTSYSSASPEQLRAGIDVVLWPLTSEYRQSSMLVAHPFLSLLLSV
ncbi:hypothetical protein BDR07DRAFT_1439939 [Suillus spraguei]|nr:hypothetical protein BDR07DRAFT_1439939 [Suillus spraguei]